MYFLNRPYFVVFFFTISSCFFDNNLQKHYGNALGTFYSIKYEGNKINRSKVQEGIDSIFFEINNSLSTYIQDSDISKINNGDSLIKVDDHFRKVFYKSNEIWEITDGYFDPTVGALVNAYGFGPDKIIKNLDPLFLDSLMLGVGMNKLKITSDGRIIRMSSKTYIDFNAIAKGYTVDCISDYLISLGNKNFLVEIGGEVKASGKNPNTGNKWRIGISYPEKDKTDKMIETFDIGNYALATSGNYNKYRIDPLTGKKITHSINPRNGLAFTSNILSTSVTAPNCITADALATALMVMPLDDGRQMIEENDNIEAVWIISENDKLIQIKSSGWD